MPSHDDVVGFRRGDRIVNVTNLSATGVALPPTDEVMLANADLMDIIRPRYTSTCHVRMPLTSRPWRGKRMNKQTTISRTTSPHHVPSRKHLPRHCSKDGRKE